ncbi:MAG TPA: hypothetical protein VFO60_05055, partial [Candidatus Dormibacteraeota bacterium]|nr:hypothetical protein [Candidatus Dormibacteraeota bacterium]
MLEAAEGTGRDWSVHLVDVDDSLAPLAQGIDRATTQAPERSCLLAMPLFGAPYPPSAVAAIGAAESRGVEVCWDVT